MFSIARVVNSSARQTLLLTTRKSFGNRSGESVRARLGLRERLNAKEQIKEATTRPTSGVPYTVGQLGVAGGALVGLGSLLYYGTAQVGSDTAVNRSLIWPDYVRERIHSTYAYFGGSLMLTAGSAVAVFRTPALLNVMARGGIVPMIASLVAMIGSGMVCRSLPYPEQGFGAKHIAWVVHSSIMGAVVAPLCILGGPIMTRAALYTTGIVAGLSSVALCAPSEKFLNWGAPLGIGLGVVFVASLGSAFLNPASALGAGFYSISMYGGLLLFSGFLLYDTQKIIKNAEQHPESGIPGYPVYDPINNCINIYMDALNIFIRMAIMLSGGGNKKR